MPKKTVVKKRDNTFQRIEVILSNREKRTRYGEFVVEGVIPINRVAASPWTIRAFVYSSDRVLSSWAKEHLDSSNCQEHIELPGALLQELSQKEDPSELLAIVEMKSVDIDSLVPKPRGFVLILDRPSSPGNLGSTIRSAESFGVDGIIVTGHAADLYDPQTIRSSRGAIFSLPIVKTASHKEVESWLTEAASAGIPYLILGTDADVDPVLEDSDLTRAIAMVMGNETSGLSKGYRELCTQIVKIPMFGTCDSLNVSCAASICMYEVVRQRRR